MATKLRGLKLKSVSLVDNPASQEDGFGAFVTMFKAAPMQAQCGYMNKPGAEKCAKCGAPMMAKAAVQPRGVAMTDPEKIAKLEADLKAATELAEEEQTKREEAEKALAAKSAELEKIQNAPEEVEKRALAALPESVRKQLTDQAATIAKMQDERELGDYVAKAKDAGLADAEGAIFQRVAKGKATQEDITALLTKFKAVREQVRVGGLFLVKGKGGDVAGDGTPAVQADALINKAMSEDKNLTRAAAEAKVFGENPELYQQYRKSATVADGK